MSPRKRAQVPSIDVLLGGYQIGQPSGATSLPTLDEYLFNPSSKVKRAEVASKYQVISAYNLRATTSSNPKKPRTLKAGYFALSKRMFGFLGPAFFYHR